VSGGMHPKECPMTEDAPIPNMPPEKSDTAPNPRKQLARKVTVAICSACAIPGLIYCTFIYHHSCMAGHWRHPPYPAWEIASDAIWVSLLAVAIVFSYGIERPRLLLPVCFTTIAFSSISGGYFQPLEIVLLVAITISLWVGIVRMVFFGKKSAIGVCGSQNQT
jgi:hypothetical protein